MNATRSSKTPDNSFVLSIAEDLGGQQLKMRDGSSVTIETGVDSKKTKLTVKVVGGTVKVTYVGMTEEQARSRAVDMCTSSDDDLVGMATTALTNEAAEAMEALHETFAAVRASVKSGLHRIADLF